MENQIPIIPKVDGQQTTVTHTKPNNLLVILLLILLVISIVILGFFTYQTQKLTKELAVLNDEQALVSSPTPNQVISPELTAEQDATLDSTVNWKTYINTKYSYTFKYPQNYSVESNGWTPPSLETWGWIIVVNFENGKFPDEPRFSVSLVDSKGKTLEQRAKEHFDKWSTFSVDTTYPGYVDNQVIISFTKSSFQNREIFTYTIKGSTVEDGAAEGIGAPIERKYLWVENNNNIFLIRIDNISPVNQILSTFKFIN